MDPSWWTLAWQGLAALVTLAIFSFLFGDNPIYKFTERLWVGIATGYWTMLLYHQGLYDKVVVPVFSHGQIYYLIPVLLPIAAFGLIAMLGWIERRLGRSPSER